MLSQDHSMVREAVGVFSRPGELQDAIDGLLSSGFHRAELSLLASEHAVEEKLGHRYAKVKALRTIPQYRELPMCRPRLLEVPRAR
jgi:hypothetical protein